MTADLAQLRERAERAAAQAAELEAKLQAEAQREAERRAQREADYDRQFVDSFDLAEFDAAEQDAAARLDAAIAADPVAQAAVQLTAARLRRKLLGDLVHATRSRLGEKVPQFAPNVGPTDLNLADTLARAIARAASAVANDEIDRWWTDRAAHAEDTT